MPPCLQTSFANTKTFGVKRLRTDKVNLILKEKLLNKILNSWPIQPIQPDIKGTVLRDLRGIKVVSINRSSFNLPTLCSGF
jgi:hypothetical protein